MRKRRHLVTREFLEEASSRVRPTYAQGMFPVALGYISYYVVFDYDDPLGYYDVVVNDEKLYDQEVYKLYANMQESLDSEEVIVNDVRVRPKVVLVDIGFRGSKRRVYITFAIRFPAPVKPGRNVYENRYESEIAEYDYVAYWLFPPGSRILEVDMGATEEDWEIVGDNVLVIYGRRGRRTSGYEKIVFTIPAL